MSLDLRRPARLPSGAATPPVSAGPQEFESIDPALFPRDRQNGPHWDGSLWHDGTAYGVEQSGGWAWLYRDGARWWGVAGESRTPLLRHEGLWWVKESGLWFLVHDGRPWAWRSFQDWRSEGFYNPSSGAEMVYSRDLSRVAIIAPGQGANIYDAATGEEIADIPESAMPARRRPKIPEKLPAPQDVFGR